MMIKKDYFYDDLMYQLNDSIYVPSWVQTYMKSKNLIQTSIKNIEPFNFRIYHKNADNDFIKQMKKQNVHLKSYFESKVTALRKKTINIALILSDRKKFIDKNKSKIIDKDNINSGLCIHNDDPKAVHIIIYRKEDLMKVLFHELIHYTGADLRSYDDSKIHHIEMMIKRYIPSLSNVEIYFNEAFTEALARYHYSYFLSKQLGLKTNTLLKKQQKHSTKVVKEFLGLYDCRNLIEFSKLDNYNEKSHAFSYIVISSALLHSENFILDVIKKKDMDNLQKIVYEALTQNKLFERTTTVKITNKQRFHFKLSI